LTTHTERHVLAAPVLENLPRHGARHHPCQPVKNFDE
jgi:hypothetical protein